SHLDYCLINPDLHSFPTRRSSDLSPVSTVAVVHEQRIQISPRVPGPVPGRRISRRLPAWQPEPWLLPAGPVGGPGLPAAAARREDRKSTRLNSSHVKISYAVFCLK